MGLSDLEEGNWNWKRSRRCIVALTSGVGDEHSLCWKNLSVGRKLLLDNYKVEVNINKILILLKIMLHIKNSRMLNL